MKQTREQRLTELLQASTTNTTAHSMVHATIRNNARAGWAWFWFGIIGMAFSNAQHDESGFAMIDEGKIYFYKVTGLGKKQTIEGRREIAFSQIERVRRVKGSWLAPAVLNIRWRNNKNKRMDLVLGNAIGGMMGNARKQFPNQHAHINALTQLILANNVEIRPDRTTRILLLIVVSPLILLVLLGLAYLFIEVL